ncbi:MAG: Fe-Mn family superoxide dismutase [bacterium]|nr:Fe-Mn family superoxide dismutase [bacterium]
MFEAQNFDRLLGTPGFSDDLLKNHFTLYQGYVKNANLLRDTLTMLAREGKTTLPEYAELKRRFGWESNGMRLHELYFWNMINGGVALNEASPLTQQIIKDFGSYEVWEKDFRGTGAMRGIGWAVLCYDFFSKSLTNVWINEHDLGHLVGSNPLLVLDVFEHAFMLDYGLKRADYIENFFKAIDWSIVEKRFSFKD